MGVSKLEQFGEILKKVDKSKVSADFWENEKESFKQIDEEYNPFERSIRISHEKLHKEFNI